MFFFSWSILLSGTRLRDRLEFGSWYCGQKFLQTRNVEFFLGPGNKSFQIRFIDAPDWILSNVSRISIDGGYGSYYISTGAVVFREVSDNEKPSAYIPKEKISLVGRSIATNK
jgi:hypothetical protein